MAGDRFPKISAVIIAMDEEDRIEPCLRSLAGWVDEIIRVPRIGRISGVSARERKYHELYVW